MAANSTKNSTIRFGFTDTAAAEEAIAQNERRLVLNFHNLKEEDVGSGGSSIAPSKLPPQNPPSTAAVEASNASIAATGEPGPLQSTQRTEEENPHTKKRRVDEGHLRDGAETHGGQEEDDQTLVVKEHVPFPLLLPWLAELKLDSYADAAQVWIDENGPYDLNEVKPSANTLFSMSYRKDSADETIPRSIQ